MMKRACILLLALMVSASAQTRPNPADLGSFHRNRWTVEVPGGSGMFTNNSFSTGYWNANIAGDEYWDSDEVAAILRKIPDKGFRAGGRVDVSVMGVRYRNFALGVNMHGAGLASVPKEIAEIALLGTQLDQTAEFSDLVGSGYLISDYSLSYGRPVHWRKIPGLTAGLAVHVYQGHAFSEAAEASGALLATESQITGNATFEGVTAFSGFGLGADLGFAAPVAPDWNVSLAVRQLGASVNWSVDETTVSTFETDAAGIAIDSLDDDDYLDRVFQSESETAEGGSHRLTLGTYVESQVHWQAKPRLGLDGTLIVHPRETLTREAQLELYLNPEYAIRRWLSVTGGIGHAAWLGPVFEIGSGLHFRSYQADLSLTTGRGFFSSSYGGGLRLTQRVLF